MSELPQVSKGPAYPPVRADRVRLFIFLYRKEGMSFEDFDDYWRKEHAAIFARLPIAKKNILKYEQLHKHQDVIEAYKGMGQPMADYDGIAVFDAISAEKLQELFQDKEYLETVVPDEETFLDRKRAVVFPTQIVDVFNEPS